MSNPEFDADNQADDQDGAETFDETNLTEDGLDLANFDELPDLFDATQARGDAEDDPALDAADFDPEGVDLDEAEEDETRNDYAVDIGAAGVADQRNREEDAVTAGSVEGLDQVRDADSVEGGEDDFTNYQSRQLSDADLFALGYAADAVDPTAEAQLDEGLEETFPASDPVSITPPPKAR